MLESLSGEQCNVEERAQQRAGSCRAAGRRSGPSRRRRGRRGWRWRRALVVNSHHRCTLLAFSAYVKQIARSVALLCPTETGLEWSGRAAVTHNSLHAASYSWLARARRLAVHAHLPCTARARLRLQARLPSVSTSRSCPYFVKATIEGNTGLRK